MQAVFAYALKLRLAEKWSAMSDESGMAVATEASIDDNVARCGSVSARSGRVVGVNGNIVTVEFDTAVTQNEVAYVSQGDVRLIAEVIRVRGR